MPYYTKPTQLRCTISGDEEFTYMKVELLDNIGNFITTMEYSDITKDYTDLLKINEEAHIFDDEEELKKELAEGKLDRFMNDQGEKQRIDLLMTIRSQVKHQQGICGDDCILCNPDLGSDPFPDFNFRLKNSNTEGNS